MKKIQIFILGIAFYFLITNINFVDILSRPKPMVDAKFDFNELEKYYQSFNEISPWWMLDIVS